MYKKKKRAITLIEILVVIALIAIIGAVVGYNVRGGLKKGQQFKTEVGKQKLEDLLNLEFMRGNTKFVMDSTLNRTQIEEILISSGLVNEKEAKALVTDGEEKSYECVVNSSGLIVQLAK